MDKVQFVDCKVSKFQPSSTALALDQNGKVYAWGSNQMGQLGHGDTRERKLPTQLQALKRKKVSGISVGDQFVVLLGKDVTLAEQQLKREKKRMRKQRQKSLEHPSAVGDNSRVGENTTGTDLDMSRSIQIQDQRELRQDLRFPVRNNHSNSKDLIYNNLQKISARIQSSREQQSARDSNRHRMNNHPSFGRFERAGNLNSGKADYLAKNDLDIDYAQNRSKSNDMASRRMTNELNAIHKDIRATKYGEVMNPNQYYDQNRSRSYSQERRTVNESESKTKHSSQIIQELDARSGKTQELLKKANERSTGTLPEIYGKSTRDNYYKSQFDHNAQRPDQNSLSEAYDRFEKDLRPPPHPQSSLESKYGQERNRNIPNVSPELKQDSKDSVFLREQIKAQQSEIEALRQQKDCLEQEVLQIKKDFEVRLSQICADQKVTLREKEEVSKLITDERRGKDEMQIENRELKYEVRKMQSNCQELEQKNREIERRNQRLEQQNDELIQKNRTLEQEDMFKAQKITEVEKFNIDFQESITELRDKFEEKVRKLQQENDELRAQSEQKEGRIKHQFQQMCDDENKIKSIEAKIRDNEDYIEKILFEQNEFKMKAHAAETTSHQYKIEVERLINQVNSQKMERESQEQLMRQREHDQRQLETSFNDLRNNYENQIKLLNQDKSNMSLQLTDAVAKNQKLIHTLNQKHVENQKYFRTVEEGALAKAQITGENRRLEEIIRDLQNKNLKLGELLDQNMFNRAETYKSKILETLNKPRDFQPEQVQHNRSRQASSKSPDNIPSMYNMNQYTQVNSDEAYGTMVRPDLMQQMPLNQMNQQELDRAAQQSIREVRMQLERRSSARREHIPNSTQKEQLATSSQASTIQPRPNLPIQGQLKTLDHKSIRNRSLIDGKLESAKQTEPQKLINQNSSSLTEGQQLYQNYLSTNRPPETQKLNEGACATPTSTTLSNHLQSNHVQYSKNDMQKLQKETHPHSQRSVISQETQSYSQVDLPNYDNGPVSQTIGNNLPHFGQDKFQVQNVTQSLNQNFDVNRKSFDYTPKNFPDQADIEFQNQLRDLSVQPLNEHNKQFLHQHVSMQQIEEKKQEPELTKYSGNEQLPQFYPQPSSEATRKASPQPGITKSQVMSPVEFLRQSQECQRVFEQGDPNNFTMINQPSSLLSPASQSMPNSKSFQLEQRVGVHQEPLNEIQGKSMPPAGFDDSMRRSVNFEQSQITDHHINRNDRERSPIDSQLMKIEAILGKSSQKQVHL